jgi:hypothetical protein
MTPSALGPLYLELRTSIGRSGRSVQGPGCVKTPIDAMILR